ncbi:hypothetical protein [Nocardia arthritidis]|uniref:Uncharacterized protein n=1 Tax=Nocardia arthritidis TaxID=228602 RepID=A0A6G9YCV6_9NOCA|nr:hypothetical protein [Nocardia arthritidis]QIS10843.1 hypothetical protein F5544_14795 [Nocardia arthritidis]
MGTGSFQNVYINESFDALATLRQALAKIARESTRAPRNAGERHDPGWGKDTSIDEVLASMDWNEQALVAAGSAVQEAQQRMFFARDAIGGSQIRLQSHPGCGVPWRGGAADTYIAITRGVHDNYAALADLILRMDRLDTTTDDRAYPDRPGVLPEAASGYTPMGPPIVGGSSAVSDHMDTITSDIFKRAAAVGADTQSAARKVLSGSPLTGELTPQQQQEQVEYGNAVSKCRAAEQDFLSFVYGQQNRITTEILPLVKAWAAAAQFKKPTGQGAETEKPEAVGLLRFGLEGEQRYVGTIADGALADVKKFIHDARDLPNDALGTSAQAYEVVQTWKSACDQRLTELDECIGWARGLFGDLGLAVKMYTNTEEDNAELFKEMLDHVLHNRHLAHEMKDMKFDNPDKLLTGLEPDAFDTVAGGKELGDVGLDNQIAGLRAGDPEAGGEVGRRG